LGIDIVFNY